MTSSHVSVLNHHDRSGEPGGRLVVDRLPQLASHHGTPPDLFLRWGAMPRTATVDVVVHLHGHSDHGRQMHLVRDKVPISGLDLVDPAHPATGGRRAPTLLVLPRGNFYGGRSGHGYGFPALTAPGTLHSLVDTALRRFSAASGVRATRGRLILTAHSGGGSALMAILRHANPDEVHTFDALYSDPAPLIAWARRRQGSPGSALRVLFRPGEPTAANSLRVAEAIGSASRRFRVERTTVPHLAIPRTFGWRLLADAGADLPGAIRTHRPARAEQEQEYGGTPPSALCTSIARIADEEYRRWRPGGATALTETNAAASPILREYYRVGVQQTVTDAEMRSTAYQVNHPWSAVFISYVMRKAGAGPTAFKYSTAHQSYIREARANRLNKNAASPFWAFRATEIAPAVGDLVCAARANSGATYDNIADPQMRSTHCDVVTKVEPGRIRVIGGNVSQTVGDKWLRIRPDGKLDLSGSQSLLFAVIRCRSGQAAAPPATTTPWTFRLPWPFSSSTPYAPTRTPTTPTPAPVPTDLNGRVARVMRLLTSKYGYPVNGAAGLVGNLIAESQVQPNRLEGSKSDTPMRMQDFAGQVRDFTPDQIRDRSFSRKTGPRLPGIGLAQWTSPDRRTGLFAHTYQGRQLGSAIVFDLDAQVDYLVTELRSTTYRSVDVVLRRPGVTLEQASDEVVLNFERPADVLNKPTSDPGVQVVLNRRRGFGRQALQIHRGAGPA